VLPGCPAQVTQVGAADPDPPDPRGDVLDGDNGAGEQEAFAHGSTLAVNVHMKSSIGAVARRFGLAPHVLRHWESIGLLTPARSGGQRRYDESDLARVAVILMSKEAGLGRQGNGGTRAVLPGELC
jgi:MerR-like DNA binding protein